jgi:ApeA N-terminal domain 1/Apea-like HEPN
MESFEYEGIFWAVDQPERRLAGRLTYKPTEGASLDLFGAFDPPDLAMNVTGPARRVIGIAGAKDLTLDGCIPRSSSIQGPGIIRQEYYVPVVLSGVQLEVEESTDFDSVTLQFDQLPFWVKRQNFTVSFETPAPNDLSTIDKWIIASEILPEELGSGDDLEVVLSSTVSMGGDRTTEMHLSKMYSLTFRYHERRALDEIMTDINGIQDLLTLTMDAPAVPTLIQFRRTDFTHQLASGKVIELPIDAYWQIFAEHVRQEKPTGNSMFFSFDQVGGVQALANWVTVSRKYRLVLGLLLTIRYSQRLYQENRFTNVISAAETFDRMRFPNEVTPKADFRSRRRKIARTVTTALGRKSGDWVNEMLQYGNEPRLRDRLIRVASHVGDIFSDFVGDVELWARIVTLLRNRLTHHDPNQAIDRQPGDLEWAAESIYVLIMLALLRECEIPESVIETFRNSRRVSFIQGHLSEMIPRLAQYVRR